VQAAYHQWNKQLKTKTENSNQHRYLYYPSGFITRYGERGFRRLYMKIITESTIDISESLASYMLASHIYYNRDEDAVFEKRMNYVTTGQFSRCDIYYADGDMGIEIKSIAHGVECLKGVLQASIYKEQVTDGVFCMQQPRRKALRDSLESMCGNYGIGLIYIQGIPSICSKDNITQATGGCAKPFEIWKKSRFTTTRANIITKSRSGWADEYIKTLDNVIHEYGSDIFKFKIQPEPDKNGLCNIHEDTKRNTDANHTVGDFCG
jgi:hypothetical protein